jgi:short-subunit dehydrogenase
MKTALITGASAGIGTEFAKLLAHDGHSLILVARRKDRLNELAIELKTQYPGIDVTVIDMDLSEIGSGQKLFDRLKAQNLKVDVLVNNAGIGSNGEFAKQALTKELQIMDLNMRAVVELTHLLIPEMIANRKGQILNVGSTAGFQPGPIMATYYASKAFVNSWSESLHEELKPYGIAVTVLTPGPTKTEFVKAAEMEESRLFKLLATSNPKEVAAYGIRALNKGKAIATPGLMNRLVLQSLRFTPRFLVRKMVGFINRQDALTFSRCSLIGR